MAARIPILPLALVAVLGLLAPHTEVDAFGPLLSQRHSVDHYTNSIQILQGPQRWPRTSTRKNTRVLLRLQQQDSKQDLSSFDGLTTPNLIEDEDASENSRNDLADADTRKLVGDGSVEMAASVIGQQSILIPVSLVLGNLLETPFRLDIDDSSVFYGLLAVLPLALMAIGLDVVEERFPALKDVTIATQRAVLLFLGGTFRPLYTSVAAMGIGLAAGFGEELLFRGVIQTKLAETVDATFTSTADISAAIAILLSSLVFGALHAVTPLYVFLAMLASIYFGYLMVAFDGNLAVPIICHAVYDFGALVYAHWEVGKMTIEEKMTLLQDPREVKQ